MTEIIEFLIDKELVILCGSFLILIFLYVLVFYIFISKHEQYLIQEKSKVSDDQDYQEHQEHFRFMIIHENSSHDCFDIKSVDEMSMPDECTSEPQSNIRFSRSEIQAEKAEERIEFSVFAPQKILAGKKFILEVWAYNESEYDYVLKNINKSVLYKELSSKHGLRIKTESVLSLTLAIDGLEIVEPMDTVIWAGHATNVCFIVNVPATFKPGDYSGSVTISCLGLVIARLKFIISIEDIRSENPINITQERFYPQTAFASYATNNRDQVLQRIHGMQKVRPDLDIFLDVFSLRSGDNWLEKLEEHVPTKDIFYLFWSSYAAKSEWVEREWKLALTRRGLDYISPVPLEDIRDSPPPDELKLLQFSDPINSLIGYEVSRMMHQDPFSNKGQSGSS